jgi:tetratricopeptide (TPR) repeat protein
VLIEEPRKGFDYASFEARLQSLWFQRKTFLANGRNDDATQQLEQIRSFCAEEGVGRLDELAGALVAEAGRTMAEGNYERALDSLHFAEVFDRGRPQIHRARAAVLWQADHGLFAAGLELLRALRAAALRSIESLSVLHRLIFVSVTAVMGCLLAFCLLMLLRYQRPFRHEIEELLFGHLDERGAAAAAWVVLLLPLLLWFAAGWAVFYWVVITFRFMMRSERFAAVTLLAAGMLAAPAYRAGVALYGTTADPAVRTTLAARAGGYDPDRIVRLRQLVDNHPDDAVYRFLLASLYKNGRYFEEAFLQYKEALQRNPALEQAHINIGNIFYTTGQYAEATAHYRRALELNPDSFLAWFNLHLAQSEAFHFTDAARSIERARMLDARRLAELLSDDGGWGDRAAVHDAHLALGSIWKSALSGQEPFATLRLGAPADPPRSGWHQLLNPTSLGSLLALLGCAVMAVLTARSGRPARGCIRCGRAFCRHCRDRRESQEYCVQCLHLFVLGDGLVPGTKARKLYEIRRYERRSKLVRTLLGVVLPGARQVLRGRPLAGLGLMVLWFAILVASQPWLLSPIEHWSGIEFHLDLLRSPSVPARYGLDPLAPVALLSLPIIWAVGLGWNRRRQEA